MLILGPQSASHYEVGPLLFKHSADRIPVLCILALTALDFALFFFVDSITFLFCYFLLMIIPKGHICAWNHHHQHTPYVQAQATESTARIFLCSAHGGHN
jgi:hypothetical protein